MKPRHIGLLVGTAYAMTAPFFLACSGWTEGYCSERRSWWAQIYEIIWPTVHGTLAVGARANRASTIIEDFNQQERKPFRVHPDHTAVRQNGVLSQHSSYTHPVRLVGQRVFTRGERTSEREKDLAKRRIRTATYLVPFRAGKMRHDCCLTVDVGVRGGCVDVCGTSHYFHIHRACFSQQQQNFSRDSRQAHTQH